MKRAEGPEGEIERLTRDLVEARKDADWYLERCQMRFEEHDALRAEVERLKVECERKDAAWREQAAQVHAATLTALDRAEAAERKLAMAREALTKTRDIVSRCAIEGFNYERSPIDELYTNNGNITRTLAAIDAKDGEKDDRHP